MAYGPSLISACNEETICGESQSAGPITLSLSTPFLSIMNVSGHTCNPKKSGCSLIGIDIYRESVGILFHVERSPVQVVSIEDSHDFEMGVSGQNLSQPFEGRHFFDARGTPGSPEIDQHDRSSHIREFHRIFIDAREIKIRCYAADCIYLWNRCRPDNQKGDYSGANYYCKEDKGFDFHR